MQPRAEFLFLAEELRSYILSFLPYKDILRCTSVCKALRQTYISSSNLQYITELGGQQLIPVSNTNLDDHTSISKRLALQLLTDKAHAWFKFDIRSFETVSVPEQFHDAKTSLADGHLYLFDQTEQSAKIFPILPRPSQQTINRDWSPGSLCLIPNSECIDLFMDPAQNLIAIAYMAVDNSIQSEDEKFHIDLGALDVDGVHPEAAGRTLFLSGLPSCPEDHYAIESWKLEGLGRHIAFRRSLLVHDEGNYISGEEIWCLQIWDWQHSTMPGWVLSDTTIHPEGGESIDFCFLGNDRLLIVSKNLKLYSIEDASQTPQLLACFLMPVSLTGIQCLLPMDDIAHGSQLQMQAKKTMWTSDPKNRILCIVTHIPSNPSACTFVISTRIFFDLQAGVVDGLAEIPWECWGALHARIFLHHWQCRVGVSGNRVLQAFPATTATVDDEDNTDYRLHMMDFSPLAVERRQGLGRVVTEPSTMEITDSGEKLTTSLPYVEVVSDRVFNADQLMEIWVDKDRIYLPRLKIDDPYSEGIDQLEVIEI
ncbi:uncharacterized protein EDB91DRAFT_1113810 [Suillus paluster]|uniref:uncharacterized protein n=1 Tax=Suillus paluster TaxID=48578 RepID=UPI001B8677D7|nr:uncharacterized protein EDB91DRAFT_1113810 [Suillus paluster]KAG1748401.1 hypothetical protein EDB91DRAFT_1113810 [Suillus paluster]